MKHDKPAIGRHWAECCVLDTDEIRDQEEVDYLNGHIEETWVVGFFDTEEELLLYLSSDPNFDEDATGRQKEIVRAAKARAPE